MLFPCELRNGKERKEKEYQLRILSFHIHVFKAVATKIRITNFDQNRLSDEKEVWRIHKQTNITYIYIC